MCYLAQKRVIQRENVQYNGKKLLYSTTNVLFLKARAIRQKHVIKREKVLCSTGNVTPNAKTELITAKM